MSPVTLAIGTMHAAFDPSRAECLAKCTERIDQTDPRVRLFHVERDTVRRGPLDVARSCWDAMLKSDATHGILLNDDHLPCHNFVDVACKAIAAKPNAPISFYANSHSARKALAAQLSWYSTVDGATQVTAPLAMLRQFCTWERMKLIKQCPLTEDARFDLWCMAHGLRIHQTAVSLVDHQNPPSLCGNDHHEWRRPSTPPWEDMSAIKWDTAVLHAGRAYLGNHWGLLHWLEREEQMAVKAIKRAYALAQEAEAG